MEQSARLPKLKLKPNQKEEDKHVRFISLNFSVKYLCLLKEPNLILKSKLARQAILNMYLINFKLDKLYFTNVVINKSLDQILLNLIDQFYESLFTKAENLDKSFRDDLNLAKYICGLFQSLTNYSSQFCIHFHEIKGLEVLFKFITNESIIRIVSKKQPFDLDLLTLLQGIIRTILGTVHNLAKVNKKFQNYWTSLKSTNVFLNLIEQFESIENLRNISYMVIGEIASDQEISTLPQIHLVLEHLIKITIKMVSQFLIENKPVFRIKIQLDENEQEYKQVLATNYKGILWNIYEILMTIYKLSVNDLIKQEIYFEKNLKEQIILLINYGNDMEIEWALYLLWQLCFDERIAKDVNNDSGLITRIEKLKSSSSSKVVKNCQGICWLLEQKNNPVKDLENSLLNDENLKSEIQAEVLEKDKKHIMISYNRESRGLCLQIKKELENDGHSVWIDVEDIHGSSLESMANAIEGSKCVLMCMTENYKQSTFCRAEAEYAFQLNKPIIPLIMQKDYKPDGWLGIILGSKIFVNFTKYDYEECIRRLKEEVLAVSKKKKSTKPPESILKTETKLSNSNEYSKQNEELSWTQEQVEKWFTEKNLNLKILEQLTPCNGLILRQLYNISTIAPEFFFHSLASKNELNLRDVTVFTLELNNLFKK